MSKFSRIIHCGVSLLPKLPHALHCMSCCTYTSQSQPQQGLLAVLRKVCPFPDLLFRWKMDRDSGNLINPFMRVTNQMTRHFATLKASQLRLPLTRAWMSRLTLTFKAPGRIHILYITSCQDAWFQLNCRTPLTDSVLLWYCYHLCIGTHETAVVVRMQSQRQLWYTRRANPFPKVTDRFCRLP